MMRFRPKLGSERDSEWRCFFCLHVRTGTILLAVWHLFLHVLTFGLLLAIIREPRLLIELEKEPVSGADWGEVGSALPTPLSNVETPPSPQRSPAFNDHTFLYHDVDRGALLTVCTLAITLLMIYGAVRGKPAHLLPFFCLQLFDFAITVLTVTGYLCYLRSVHHLVAEARRVPWRTELLRLPAPALAFLVLAVFMAAILVKGYCISVVWRCYKYLTMRLHAMNSLTPFVISHEGAGVAGGVGGAGAGGLGGAPAYAPPTPDYSVLLPNYEEAVKQSPPPSYRAATLMAAAHRDVENPPVLTVPSSVVVVVPQDNRHHDRV